MMYRIKLLALFWCVFIENTSHAGQGMFIRVESNLNNIELVPTDSRCVYDTINILPNKTYYLEADNSGACFFQNSFIIYNAYVAGVFLQQYNVGISVRGSTIFPQSVVTTNGFQLTATLFPHFRPVGTQDSILIHIQEQADAWQGDNSDLIGHQSVNRVIMIGSHDSGSYGINKDSFLTGDVDSKLIDFATKIGFQSIIAKWSKTQNFNIATQLNLGVRYLDLRLCGNRYDGRATDAYENIYLCHKLSGEKIGEVIEQVANFLNFPGHEKELVILDINHLYNLTDEQLNHLTKMLQEKFGDKIASPMQFTPVSSYNDFWNFKKQVIISITADHVVKKYSDIYWPQYYFSSPWPDTTDKNFLISAMTTNLRTRDFNQFFVLQSQETPNPDSILASFNPFHNYPNDILQMTGTYKLDVSDWLFKNNVTLKENGNIVIQDFVK